MRIVFTGICLVSLVGCAVNSAIAPVLDLKTDNQRLGVMQSGSQFVYCNTCPKPTPKTPFNAPEATTGTSSSSPAARGRILREGTRPPKTVATPRPAKRIKVKKIVKPTRTEAFGELLYITHFGFDSAEVSSTEKVLIRQRVLKFYRSPGTITLIGYTDNRGDKRYNDWLAMRRALAVKEYLVKNGMDPRRIKVTAFGKCCYLQMNSTRAGRLANRRVEIRRAVGRG